MRRNGGVLWMFGGSRGTQRLASYIDPVSDRQVSHGLKLKIICKQNEGVHFTLICRKFSCPWNLYAEPRCLFFTSIYWCLLLLLFSLALFWERVRWKFHWCFLPRRELTSNSANGRERGAPINDVQKIMGFHDPPPLFTFQTD